VLAGLADQAATRWREPDQGLWETRRPPSHHLSSKVMCWVALDRALGLAAAGKLQGDIAGWRSARDAIRETVLADGFNPRIGAFTQVLGGDTLDASVLVLPLCGFIPADDPRMVATVQRIQADLTENGLVLRYREDDGLPGREGAFALCSFWLVENLALQGRLSEAHALYERLLGLANDVGLMSEEIDPASGELLGNHPQGYTHLAIICAALTLHRAGQATGAPVAP
jgi:GH15 family glucan-1,4-alpha-glucosidase